SRFGRLGGRPWMQPIGLAAQSAALGSDVEPPPDVDVEVDPELEVEPPELLVEVEPELFGIVALTPLVTIAPEGAIACQTPPPPCPFTSPAFLSPANRSKGMPRSG